MSVTKPSWWYSEEEERPRYNPESLYHRRDTYNEHSDIPKKKKTKLSKIETPETQKTVKELSKLLINKTEAVEILQKQLDELRDDIIKYRRNLEKKTSEYDVLYTENCVLRKLVDDLDLDKPKSSSVSSNNLFLHDNAPQEVVDIVWKTLSKKYHPDCGGSEEKMKQLNSARDGFYKKNGWR